MEIYRLNSIINFGKHRGKSLEQVFKEDPKYIEWAIKTYKTEKTFILPLSEFKINYLDKNIFEINSISNLNFNSLREINSDEKTDLLSPFLQQIPQLAAIAEMNMAYRLVLPQGAIGELMKIGQGYGTALTINGTIVSHGTYVPINTDPLIVFSFLSVITGLYFIKRVDKSLLSISKDINFLKTLFLNDKDAEIEATYKHFKDIESILPHLMQDDNYRGSYMTNLINQCISLNQKILFYQNVLTVKLGEYKNSKNEFSDEDFFYFLTKRNECTRLYVTGRFLELKLSKKYNEPLLKNVNESLDELLKFNSDLNNQILPLLKNNFNEKYSKWYYKLFPFLFNNNNKKEKIQNDIKIENSFNESNKLILSIKNGITDIINLANNGGTFIFNQGRFYYEK